MSQHLIAIIIAIYLLVALGVAIFYVANAQGGVMGRMPDILFGILIAIFWPVILLISIFVWIRWKI